eukprot:3028048-Alexandrium_andersonii.AAC.1
MSSGTRRPTWRTQCRRVLCSSATAQPPVRTQRSACVRPTHDARRPKLDRQDGGPPNRLDWQQDQATEDVVVAADR